MKTWLLAIGITALTAWLLVRPMRDKVLPEMLRSGNEQILAQWRDALLAYKAEFGAFPPQDICPTREESIMNGLNRQNPKEMLFIDLASVRVDAGIPRDAWGGQLIFDYGHDGDIAHVVSAGPDGKFETADDMDSRTARQRNIPVPDELLDDREKARRKAAADAETPAGDGGNAEGGNTRDAGAAPSADAGPNAKSRTAPEPEN